MCFLFTFSMTTGWAFLRWKTNISFIISLRKMQMKTTIAAHLILSKIKKPNSKLGKVWRNWNTPTLGGMQNGNDIIYSLVDHLLFKLTCLFYDWVILFLGKLTRNKYLYSLPPKYIRYKDGSFIHDKSKWNPPPVSIKVKSTKILSRLLLSTVYKK